MTDYMTVKTRCFMCQLQCAVLVKVKNGLIIKIEGDLDDPVTEGAICSKGLAAKQLVYHPDRIRHPMKKIGSRWKRITWSEALDEIANKLAEIREKCGPEAVAFGQGTGRGWFGYFVRFVNAFGSPNWGEPGMAQCAYPRRFADAVTFGDMGVLASPDYDNTRCILVWGKNPPANHIVEAVRIIEAKARGAKLIVVDPKLTQMASKADVWLQIRPGTDGALALGMLHVIVNENLYDATFVGRWTTGIDELRKRIEEYSPDRVSEITWIPAEKIVKASRMYALTKPACITWSCPIDQLVDSVQTCRAINLLVPITGNVDIPGGNLLSKSVGLVSSHSPKFVLSENLTNEQLEKRLGAHKYPFLCGPLSPLPPGAHMPTVWKAILTGKPYPVKVMLVHGSNSIISYANSNEVMEALNRLEFLAVVDFFMTPTAKLADIVLPAATWLEKDGLVVTSRGNRRYLFFREKVVEVQECWSDEKILGELARRLGFGEYFWDDEEAYLDYMLKPLGLTFKQFKEKKRIEIVAKYKKYESEGFKTPSGRVEIHSRILETEGYDPLPFYKEPPESPISAPKLAKKYPYILTTGRLPVYRHTEFRNLLWLHEICPESQATIHPETASKLDIEEGELVVIESPRGSIKVKANVAEVVHPSVIHVGYGWHEEANVNLLTNNKISAPGIGSNVLRGLLCNIRKA